MATLDGATPLGPPDAETSGIRNKPEPRDFQSPVAWLFGRQLLANLKWILLYVAFKGKLDHRDWMNAGVIPLQNSPVEIEQFWQEWNESREASEDGDSEPLEEFWFDYLADTGDGQRAVYSIAYLCMSDLAIGKSLKLNDDVDFVLEPDTAKLKAADKMLLPRGAFLFVGGDTSYHIADYNTLANRFQNPFWWAFYDLLKINARSVIKKVPRLLFGIPGNHDWYDSLDGFNRQFRRPSTGDRVSSGGRTPQLMIPTFERTQEASFVALHLPFDWWFWGLDTEKGEIDFRQLQFFASIQNQFAPKKLIVATPEPITAFGRFARTDANISKTFAALKLERPFLKNPEPLGEGKCRVDLSGDIHHYARYWGPPPVSGESSDYASVMSGGGGAFFHPSQTNLKEVPQQMLYPTANVSRAHVADEIFKFTNIVQGGWVWLFGALIAFIICFSATIPLSSRDVVDRFPPFINLGISPPPETQSHAPLAAYVIPMPRDTFGPNSPDKPVHFYLWIISLIVSLGVIGIALGYSWKLFEATEYDPHGMKREVIPLAKRLIIWGLVIVAFACLAYGIWGFHKYYEPYLTRYARSLIILATLLWAVPAIIVSMWYSEWLFKEAYRVNIKTWRYWPIWGLLVLAVLGVGSSLWFFGMHEVAYLISDLMQMLTLLGVGIGLIYFAYGQGGVILKGGRKAALLLLGASHALLQLAVPFLLVRKGNLIWAPLAVLALVVVFKFIGRALAKLENGWPLAIAWIVFGAALLYIPFLLSSSSPEALNRPDSTGLKFLLCFYAAAIGALMSCVLFGWYLAVALAFNAHNNEAGGAARIESFKEFIRFRINRDGLTGYVIGMDKPNTIGGTGNLHPKIIDVFHLRERKDAAR
jgi:hypothetical protein